MNHITKKSPLFLPLVTAALWIGCNTIPTDISQADPQFSQYTANPKSFKVDSIAIFNEIQGYTVDFSGIRERQLQVNNTNTMPVVAIDSVFSRITNLGGAVVDVNGTVKGAAEFKQEDVADWRLLQKYLKGIPYFNFTAKVILGRLSPQDSVFIVDSSDTTAGLPAAGKTAVITALNDLLDDMTFYEKYREDIKREVFITYLIDSLNHDVLRLVEQGVFLDTLGAVKAVLSPGEREAVKWFTWKIFVRYCDNEDMAVDFGKTFYRYPSAGRVYELLFQQGSSPGALSDQEIRRYISLKSGGVYQEAYVCQGVTTVPQQSTVYSYPFMCDTVWTTTQFFWWPDIPFVSAKDVPSLLSPGKAVLNYAGFTTDDITIDSLWHYDLKLYYPLSGEVIYERKLYRIAGAIAVTVRFHKVISLSGSDIYQGHFSKWDTQTSVQLIDTDGNILSYQENCRLVTKNAGRRE